MKIPELETQFYVDALCACYRDVAGAFPAQQQCEHRRDLETIRVRVLSEGVAFLTKTLPSLAKAIDTALASGTVLQVPNFARRKGSKLPRFLGWLIGQVFHTDGTEKADADPVALTYLRSLLYLFYKLELPHSTTKENEVYTTFKEVDQGLQNPWILTEPQHKYAVKYASRLVGRIFAGVDARGIIPRHGPGSTSDGAKQRDKPNFMGMYPAIQQYYPFDEYYCWSPAHLSQNLPNGGSMGLGLSDGGVIRDLGISTAKVVLVPKDSRGPRLISMEPTETQWIQQGQLDLMVRTIENHWLTRHHVNFRNQEVNRSLALFASHWASQAHLQRGSGARTNLGPDFPTVGCVKPAERRCNTYSGGRQVPRSSYATVYVGFTSRHARAPRNNPVHAKRDQGHRWETVLVDGKVGADPSDLSNVGPEQVLSSDVRDEPFRLPGSNPVDRDGMDSGNTGLQRPVGVQLRKPCPTIKLVGKRPELVTLDMKDASDRVSLQLVQALFPSNWVEALEATRSPRTMLPTGEMVTMNKFAPMGSAVCFPVEAICFWALALASIHLQNPHLSLKELKERVWVYGDDIICYRKDYPGVIAMLERVGLKFNSSKCCTAGSFRESCGLDAYKGVLVTPTRIKSRWSHRLGVQELAAYVEYSNALHERGFCELASFLEEMVQVSHRIPYSRRDYGGIQFVRPFDDTRALNKLHGVRVRFNTKLQRLEALSLQPRLVTERGPADTYEALLYRMAQSGRLRSPTGDGQDRIVVDAGGKPPSNSKPIPVGLYPIARRVTRQRAWTRISNDPIK